MFTGNPHKSSPISYSVTQNVPVLPDTADCKCVHYSEISCTSTLPVYYLDLFTYFPFDIPLSEVTKMILKLKI